MLCANKSDGSKVIAEDVGRAEGPFYCPACKEEVHLVKRRSKDKIDFFKHIRCDGQGYSRREV